MASSKRQASLEPAFQEKKNELERRRSQPHSRANSILLAREWSYVFPDSPVPAEILGELAPEKKIWNHRMAAALLLLLIFAGSGIYYWPSGEPPVPEPVAAVVTEEIKSIAAAPAPAPRGWIKVLADDDVKVLLDGAEVPRSRWSRIPADPGNRRIRLIKEGFLPIENVIRVINGRTAVINAKRPEEQ